MPIARSGHRPIEAELDDDLASPAVAGTQSPIPDAAGHPSGVRLIAPRRREEKMHFCDLVDEKFF